MDGLRNEGVSRDCNEVRFLGILIMGHDSSGDTGRESGYVK